MAPPSPSPSSSSTPPSEEVSSSSSSDPARLRFPQCVVWCPLPFLSWFVPFIGHTGITTTDGVVHDFGGSHYIHRSSRGRMSFGPVTKYTPVSAAEVAPERWNAAVHAADAAFERKTHNLLFNNCHHHVGSALNAVAFNGFRHWGTVTLTLFLVARGRYAGPAGFFRTFAPFCLLCIIVAAAVLLYTLAISRTG